MNDQTKPPLRRRCLNFVSLCLLAMFLLAAMGPAVSFAQTTSCSAQTDVEFLTPFPYTIGSTVRMQLEIGVQGISGGTAMQVNNFTYALDCQDFGTDPSACVDDGPAMAYMNNISTTCVGAGDVDVDWTPNSAAGNTDPNIIVFSATPSVILSPNTSCFLEFDVQIQALSTDATPNIINSPFSFTGQCNNGDDGTANGSAGFLIVLGSLEVTKEVTGDTQGYDGAEFLIDVDCTDDNLDQTLSLANGASATIEDIILGTQCTLSETPPANPAGFEYGAPTFLPSDTVTIDANNTNATVTVSNPLAELPGTLIVTKLLSGATAGYATGTTFPISVNCSDGTNEQFNLAPDQNGTVLDLPIDTDCTISEGALPAPQPGFEYGTPVISPSQITITSATQAATVTVTNPLIQLGPAIDIEKQTNGLDADDPSSDTLPEILPGDPVSWDYIVTNIGDVTISGITVTDDQGVTVSCPQDSLAPGESMICNASGIAEDLDQTGTESVCNSRDPWPIYQNMGTVTGIGGQLTVTDTDPSAYCNPLPPPGTPDLEIIKQTNGLDADEPSADELPEIAPGDEVTWEYIVVNTGDVTLTNITVTDDQGVTISCPKDTLEPGEVMICTASGIAEDLSITGVEGVCNGRDPWPIYQNMGTATGLGDGQTVTDTDPSAYCNPPTTPTLGLEIVKTTNGIDGNDPDVDPIAEIAPGDIVIWEYTVTNTGDTPLVDVVVSDDRILASAIDCGDGSNIIPLLLPGPENAVTCVAMGKADNLIGLEPLGSCNDKVNWPIYRNMGSATALVDGETVSDADPDHYCNPFQAQPAPVPGISTWGLLASLFGLPLLAGFFAARRRK